MLDLVVRGTVSSLGWWIMLGTTVFQGELSFENVT